MPLYPPKADIRGHGPDVRFGPIADSCSAAKWLFDHFIGAGEQRGWDGDADHPRGLEVDDEFKLGGKLNWQMGDRGCL